VTDRPAERPRFHLAIPVHDLAAARAFYGDLLGCPEGRSASRWVDFDLHGHQLVAHVVDDRPTAGTADADRDAGPADDQHGRHYRDHVAGHNPVDGHEVPVPHFGLLLRPADWHALADRLRAAGTRFVIEPHVRFAGEPGEQWTMFLYDPSGNALEFKAFEDDDMVFAT
jgi:extradiol dioxygenase family protein